MLLERNREILKNQMQVDIPNESNSSTAWKHNTLPFEIHW